MKSIKMICVFLLLLFLRQTVLAGNPGIISVHDDGGGGVQIVVDLFGSDVPEPSRFRLREDHKVTVAADSVAFFRETGWKLTLLMCIDMSGSLKGGPLSEIKRALEKLLAREDLFSSYDRIALVTFENEILVDQWFAPPDEILPKISSMSYKKGQHTVLYDALLKSLEHVEGLEESPPELRHILVVSDGKDEGSQSSVQEIFERLAVSKVVIDVVARVHQDRVEKDLQKGYVEIMRDLADRTGGQFTHAEPGGVLEAVEGILIKIVGTSVVSFKRDIDTQAPPTKTVGFTMELPNGTLLSDETEKSIARSRSLPPPSNRRRLVVLALILAVVLVGAAVLIKRRPEKKKVITPKPKPLASGPKKVATPVTFKGGPPPGGTSSQRKTRVGGFHFPVPQQGGPSAILVGIDGPREGLSFLVEKDIVKIGADPENDLCLTDDGYVSGQHAYLRYEQGSFFIFDQGSRNGTFVNQAEITETGFVLSLGDRIQVGQSIFEVVKA